MVFLFHISQKAGHYHFWQATTREGFLLPRSSSSDLQPLNALRRTGGRRRRNPSLVGATQVMKDVAGSPGTWSGLALRLSQSLCAGASMLIIHTARDYDSLTAYCYLGFSMELQLLWSFSLACIDIHSLRTNMDLHNPHALWPLLVADWIMGTNSFAAAFTATGVTIYFKRDVHFCRASPHLPCDQYELSVILAFMALSFIAASAACMFRLLASFY